MTQSLFESAKDEIMKDVLYILDFVREDRSFLNKHFQNSMNNYFLEDYAGIFLKEYLQMQRAKDITRYISSKYFDLQGTKYMKLMYGYFEELKEAQQFQHFLDLLMRNIISSIDNSEKPSKEWQSSVWKRGFSLFVHHVCQQKDMELKGIFEIWNSLFPRSKILRKRELNFNHRAREFIESEINNIRGNKIRKLNEDESEKVGIKQVAQPAIVIPTTQSAPTPLNTMFNLSDSEIRVLEKLNQKFFGSVQTNLLSPFEEHNSLKEQNLALKKQLECLMNAVSGTSTPVSNDNSEESLVFGNTIVFPEEQQVDSNMSEQSLSPIKSRLEQIQPLFANNNESNFLARSRQFNVVPQIQTSFISQELIQFGNPMTMQPFSGANQSICIQNKLTNSTVDPVFTFECNEEEEKMKVFPGFRQFESMFLDFAAVKPNQLFSSHMFTSQQNGQQSLQQQSQQQNIEY